MADEPSLPDDIDELMKAFGVDPAKAPAPPPPKEATPQPTPTDPSPMPAPPPASPDPSSLGKLGTPTPEPAPAPASATRPSFDAFQPQQTAGGEASLDLLRAVALNVRVEVGRTKMYVQDILRLVPGSVVELERLTGDPLEIYINDRLVARGEVLVINENFAIRITEVIDPTKDQKK